MLNATFLAFMFVLVGIPMIAQLLLSSGE